MLLATPQPTNHTSTLSTNPHSLLSTRLSQQQQQQQKRILKKVAFFFFFSVVYAKWLSESSVQLGHWLWYLKSIPKGWWKLDAVGSLLCLFPTKTISASQQLPSGSRAHFTLAGKQSRLENSPWWHRTETADTKHHFKANISTGQAKG